MSTAIHINPIQLANGLVAGLLNSDPPAQDRANGDSKSRICEDIIRRTTYVVNENIGSDLLQRDNPNETFARHNRHNFLQSNLSGYRRVVA